MARSALLPQVPGCFRHRHAIRRDYNAKRLPIVLEWAKTFGVSARVLTGENGVRFSCLPRAFASWVLSTGSMTLCTDWLHGTIRRTKVYDYTQALIELELWREGIPS